MTTALFLLCAILALLFAILSVKTADVIRSYFANRKSEAASLSKRQHDQAVTTFANIFREAILMKGKAK